MPSVRDVIVSFGGDTRDFDDALTRMDNSISVWGSRLRGGLAGLGTGLGIGGVAGSFSDLIDQMDLLGKQAQSLGTTTDALYGLQFAVGQTSEVARDDFILVLQRITRHLAQAASGSKESAAIFQDLGVNVEDLTKLDAAEQFLAIADAMQKLSTDTQRASVSYRLFEEPWRQLQPTLETSTETLRELMGSVVAPTEEATRAAARLNDSLDRMDYQLQGLAFTAGPPVIDFLNGLIPLLAAGAGVLFDFGEKAAGAIRRTEEELRSWGPLGEIIRRIVDPTAQLRDVLGQVAEAGKTEPAVPTPPGEPGAESVSLAAPEPDIAAKTKVAAKEQKTTKEAAVEDTRAQVRAEAALWDFYHAELSALQEENAEAAKEAQAAQVQALAELVAAGASETRRKFYEALVEENTQAPPTGKMRVVLDEESLLALPDQLEQSLQQGDYTVTLRAQVVPTLLEDSTLERAVDQGGSVQ